MTLLRKFANFGNHSNKAPKNLTSQWRSPMATVIPASSGAPGQCQRDTPANTLHDTNCTEAEQTSNWARKQLQRRSERWWHTAKGSCDLCLSNRKTWYRGFRCVSASERNETHKATTTWATTTWKLRSLVMRKVQRTTSHNDRAHAARKKKLNTTKHHLNHNEAKK